MCGCEKCSKMGAALLIIVGLLFLAADFGWFNWGVSWFTAAFLLMGICCCAMGSCKECKKVCK